MISISSFCSGIGAFEQAMKNLDIPHKSKFACEIDKYAQQTFLANHETETMYHDMTKYDFEGEEWYSDVNVSGIPCQSFSLAGKRLGELDPRGLLFYDFWKWVKNQKPKYFIIENVKGLLSDNDGKTFQNWIALLGQSENGNTFMFPHEDSLMYNLHWQVLNTKDYGIPQNRERVFLIGIRNDLPNDFVFPKPIPLKLRLKDILEDEVDEKYYLSDRLIETFINRPQSENYPFKPIENTEEEIACCLNARYYKMGATDNYLKVSSATKSGYETATEEPKVIQISKDNKSNGGTQPYQQDRVYDSEGISPALSAGKSDLNITEPLNLIDAESGGKEPIIQVVGNYSKSNHEASRILNPNGIAPTVKENHGTVNAVVVPNDVSTNEQTEQKLEINENRNTPFIKFDIADYRHDEGLRIREDGISPCLTSSIRESEWKPNTGTRNPPITSNGYSIRKLTPRECARLQAFPDSFVFPVSNSQAYKQCGNSITVSVIQAILKNLLKNEL